MQNNDSLVVPVFKAVAIPDPIKSKEEGRPIFKEQEQVEVRFSGDRNSRFVFPAHAMRHRDNGEEVTYAQFWPEQYARFKAGHVQVADGTPLSELPFLNEAKRAELRAQSVHTAEALASLEGKNLQSIGFGGRALKNQAEAYLASAKGSASVVAMADELAALRAEMAAMRAEQVVAAPVETDDDKAALKDQIEAKTGARPRGNPSVETLQRMLAEV